VLTRRSSFSSQKKTPRQLTAATTRERLQARCPVQQQGVALNRKRQEPLVAATPAAGARARSERVSEFIDRQRTEECVCRRSAEAFCRRAGDVSVSRQRHDRPVTRCRVRVRRCGSHECLKASLDRGVVAGWERLGDASGQAFRGHTTRASPQGILLVGRGCALVVARINAKSI